MIKKIKYSIIIILLTIINLNAQSGLFQYSTIDALINGMYDGTISLAELSEKGNFGLGTFNSLDGEMIILDGHFYRVQYDGKIIEPDLNETKVPFAAITNFNVSQTFDIADVDYAGFKKVIDEKLNTENHFFAVKITGKFKFVKARSVPKQTKPYKTLTEVVKEQSVFEFMNTTGTLIGFRCPEFVNGINVPGFHMHFLQSGKIGGGHLLEIQIESAKVELDEITDFNLMVPDTEVFNNMKFEKKENQSLDKVETEKK